MLWAEYPLRILVMRFQNMDGRWRKCGDATHFENECYRDYHHLMIDCDYMTLRL